MSVKMAIEYLESFIEEDMDKRVIISKDCYNRIVKAINIDFT